MKNLNINQKIMLRVAVGWDFEQYTAYKIYSGIDLETFENFNDFESVSNGCLVYYREGYAVPHRVMIPSKNSYILMGR